jgi:hypothetical protein
MSTHIYGPPPATLPDLAGADTGALFTAVLDLAAAIEAGSISQTVVAARYACNAAADLAIALEDIENTDGDEDLAFDLLAYQGAVAHELDAALAAFGSASKDETR